MFGNLTERMQRVDDAETPTSGPAPIPQPEPEHSENQGEKKLLSKREVVATIRTKGFEDPASRRVISEWFDQQEAIAMQDSTGRAMIMLNIEQADIWFELADLEAALECMRQADDQAIQIGEEDQDLADLILKKGVAIKELQEIQMHTPYNEPPTPNEFLVASPAEGIMIREFKAEGVTIPISFNMEFGRFRLHGVENETNNGALISGRISGTKDGGIAKISHIAIADGLSNIAPAFLRDLETQLEFQWARGSIYAVANSTQEVEFFSQNGYQVISVEAISQEIKRNLKINTDETDGVKNTILMKEKNLPNTERAKNEKEQLGEWIALAKELAEMKEPLPFFGVTEEAYKKLKDDEAEYGDFMAPVDPLLERFKTEGMKVVISGDPEAGNVYVLPFGSDNETDDNLNPRQLQMTGDMNEKLKELIVRQKEIFKK